MSTTETADGPARGQATKPAWVDELAQYLDGKAEWPPWMSELVEHFDKFSDERASLAFYGQQNEQRDWARMCRERSLWGLMQAVVDRVDEGIKDLQRRVEQLEHQAEPATG